MKVASWQKLLKAADVVNFVKDIDSYRYNDRYFSLKRRFGIETKSRKKYPG
jgi:hypothetical protein